MEKRKIKFRAWDSKISKMFYFDLEDTICTTDLRVMQFTGVKDKKGNDIYEGDLIKGSWDIVLEVYYDNDYLQFRVSEKGNKPFGSKPIDWYGKQHQREIVGNICGSEIS